MKFWLARATSKNPEGPFTKADLAGMYEAGTVDMLDQVCLAGTEQWQDLGRLLDLRAYVAGRAVVEPAAAEPVFAKKKRKVVGSAGCVVFVFGLLLLILMPLLKTATRSCPVFFVSSVIRNFLRLQRLQTQ
jgi:hypothetical protein